MARSTVLATVADGGLQLARFRCSPGDRAWREPNHIGGAHVVALPHHTVGIRKRGRSGIVADPNRVILYDPGSRYDRHLIDPEGDRCTILRVETGLLQGLGARAVDGAGFATDALAVAPSVLLRIRLLARMLDRGSVDTLTVEDQLLRLAFDVLQVPVHRPDDRRPATIRVHDRLAEHVREMIAADPTADWRLDDLARALHTAPAHLHRVFRARTRTTIHDHRDRLRLARALDMVLAGSDDLAAVASSVGYSSHSHLTRRFRRVYGTTPSRVRRDGAVGRGEQVMARW